MIPKDSVSRFTGLAADYDRARPDYPDDAIAFIIGRAGLGSNSLLADVGSGTGISTRLFAARGVPVIGIEPNDDMRRQAESVPSPVGVPVPAYRAGTGEATGLPDSAADAVVAAQAFHWFRPDEALAEFHRILRPGGWVFLMWYERDETDPCTAEFAAVVRSSPAAAAIEGHRLTAASPLWACDLFVGVEKRVFPYGQRLDRDTLVARSLSISYAPRDADGVAAWKRHLGRLFDTYSRDGLLTLRYEATVHAAQKRS